MKNILKIIIWLVIFAGIGFGAYKGLEYFTNEKDNGAVESETKKPEEKPEDPEQETSKLKDITILDFSRLYLGNEISVVYIGSPYCGYCTQQQPILEKISTEYNIEINYIDSSILTDREEEDLYSTYGDEQKNQYDVEGVRTPTILLVKRETVVELFVGLTEYEELVDKFYYYDVIWEK